MKTTKSRYLIAVVMGICLALLPVSAAQAEKIPATPEISLDQAIQRAVANDEGYKDAQYEIDRTEALADYASDQMSSYANANLLGSGVPAAESSYYSYLGAELTYKMSLKSLEKREDVIKYDVTSKYGAVLVAQAKLEQAKSDASLSEQEYRINKVKHQAGMISDLEYEASVKDYESSANTLDTYVQTLDSAYAALNPVIGLWAVDRPVLTDGTVYEPIKVLDVESNVNSVLDTAPDIWLLEQTAQLKDYELNILGYMGSYRPYEARLSELDQANLDVASAKETYAKNTRNIYYQIKSVENSYAIAEDSKAQADVALKGKQALFDAGMCTKLDLDTAQNTVDSVNATLVDLKWSHTSLINAFQKPWAASGS